MQINLQVGPQNVNLGKFTADSHDRHRQSKG